MKKSILYTLLPMFILVVGCSDFGNLNDNPNASTVPSTSALLTNVLANANPNAGGSSTTAGYYCQYYSQTLYTEISRYQTQNIDWSFEYAGPLEDLQKIIDINSDPVSAPNAAFNGSNNNQIAIARILKAYRYSVLTDRYGDLPYFNALKGDTQPTFDKQQDIYTDLLKELGEAVDQFDDKGNVKGDIVYNGDNAQWKKFANTIRMILALRISNADAALGKQAFTAALASGGMESNADNFTLLWPGGTFKNVFFTLGADQKVSNTIADLLNRDGDMRLNAYGKPVSGKLIGFPFGLNRDDALSWAQANPAPNDGSLILNSTWRAENSKMDIITYSHSLLARAEAAYLGWTSENYVQLYSDGIKASWEQWGVYDATAFGTFMSDTDIALSGSGAAGDASKIGMQRWMSFYPNGPQGWSEWRRTGFPTLTPTSQALNASGKIPLRYIYPSTEETYNANGVAQGTSQMGGNLDSTPVWWDK